MKRYRYGKRRVRVDRSSHLYFYDYLCDPPLSRERRATRCGSAPVRLTYGLTPVAPPGLIPHTKIVQGGDTCMHVHAHAHVHVHAHAHAHAHVRRCISRLMPPLLVRISNGGIRRLIHRRKRTAFLGRAEMHVRFEDPSHQDRAGRGHMSLNPISSQSLPVLFIYLCPVWVPADSR